MQAHNLKRHVVTVLLTLLVLGSAAADRLDEARATLWGLVDRQIDQLAPQLGIDELSPTVRTALMAVPRHEFVPPSQRDHAYENRPLPIGHGQTISQPLIVAAMTELLQIGPGDVVFELGTGSGYQAAVLAEVGAQVYSVEIVEPLGERARETLDRLGYEQVETRIGDGYEGWPEAAPFDAVIVTAAADHIPPPLIRQLKPGGRLLIPVGNRYQTQKLVLLTRDRGGQIRTRELIPVMFVPLTGRH